MVKLALMERLLVLTVIQPVARQIKNHLLLTILKMLLLMKTKILTILKMLLLMKTKILTILKMLLLMKTKILTTQKTIIVN